ncbi:hypothetical protein HPB49_004497 [Dermacentor silvarum]|uniref:Uncharacterized protein n=1 Tax=Dermacentor silvarum TaxID=543639 RepID=A0ACB8DU21_DERSI|nr:hypothetical protein HPB49_004497 [Dermacentor silvarum]
MRRAPICDGGVEVPEIVALEGSMTQPLGQKFAMLELKVLLAKVLTNFSVSSCNHRDDLLFDADILLRTKRPIRIRLQPRHGAGFK